ncbi:MAG: type II secretion system minor pseudopilin GspK [Gammaproteobacteria bacterium]|nr:type II secretion system minor pseudopilin GspK [Gammaproteobacteria bacterium]
MRANLRQQGVALITAILVVSLASVLAISLVNQLHLDISRSENILHHDQAYLYVLGVEDFALLALQEDEKKYDALDEEWHTTKVVAPVEGGQVTGALTDLQGLFNLNNLTKGNKNFDQHLQHFKRLLKNNELDENLANAVIDWLDEDLETSIPGGAEDDYYLGLEKPYRTANYYFRSPSELRLVKGFDLQETYDRLIPLVATLPENTSININTAPREVLESLHEDIAENIDKILQQRDGDVTSDNSNGSAFESLADFETYMKNTLKKTKFSAQSLPINVTTDYFLLQSDAEVGRGHVKLYSTIFRNDKTMTIINRSQGTW